MKCYYTRPLISFNSKGSTHLFVSNGVELKIKNISVVLKWNLYALRRKNFIIFESIKNNFKNKPTLFLVDKDKIILSISVAE